MAKRKDQEFLDWLSYRPSCLDRAYSEWDGEYWRNVACHVRRAANSGTGFKPLFSAVPMTRLQHDIQHRNGEYAVIVAYADSYKVLEKYEGNAVKRAKDFFDEQAKKYLEIWTEKFNIKDDNISGDG